MSNDHGKKVWFVTGSSSGFGAAIVGEARRRGDVVVATSRSASGEESLDVTKPAEIAAAIRAAIARYGRIDVLVNNAGYSLVGAVEETSDDELRLAMEPMFFGAVALTRAVLPHMRERRSGTIVQITSMGGLTTAPGFGAYCAAKHALEGLTECLAAEVAPFGVKTIIVEPGAFRTRLFGGAFRAMPAMDAYATTVGPTRAYAASMDGKQQGDPEKAATAIVDAVLAGAPTLRLPLGGDAVDAIGQKLAMVAADVERTEAVARATAFTSPS